MQARQVAVHRRCTSYTTSRVRPTCPLHPSTRHLHHASRPLVTAAAASTDPTTACKAEVMKAVSGTARGKNTSEQQRRDILSKITALESLNNIPNPADSQLLSGCWALLYQAPLDEQRAKVDKSGTTEGPFLAAFQPVTRDFVRTKNNLQLIDLPNSRVENLAEFTIAGRWDGYLNIVGSGNKIPPVAGEPATRVAVEFQEFVLKLGPLNLRVPLSWVKARGWVETTYLDPEMRVGRGDKGSIFVASRLKDTRWPAAQP